ncbi:ClpP family protease [Nakamurella sp.]|uniref:ClpP family protease n=1 Tax=Nakamurella sp. TaxID=1869182 RepID=UPI003B3A6BF7
MPTLTAPAATGLSGSFDDQLAGRLLHQRIVVLGQQVDDPIANRICAQLLLLSAEDPRADISLYINSPGGSVSAGLAIYDTMRLIPNDVSTLAMGLAASMGQFLLTAGTPGKRFALPHSRILMHQGSAGIGGTAVDVQIQAENLEYVKGLMTRLTAEHTGQDEATIDRDADRDRWFTAAQAVDYGLVDGILRTTSDIRPAADRHRIGLGPSEPVRGPHSRPAGGPGVVGPSAAAGTVA